MNRPTDDRRPFITLIAAVARNGGIGRDNELLWRESDDLKRFKQLTLGKPIIMGRKTWDSLGRPLPGRRNIVITRHADWHAAGTDRAASLVDALRLVGSDAHAFIIGGAQIYAEALPIVDELRLTEIDADFDADTFFPAWPRAEFDEIENENRSDAQGVGYRFVTYRRRH